MKTTLLTPETDENAIKTAAELIRQGEVVGMPTETVYGLAANALNGEAVKKIFLAKGRPQDNPLIVHIADFEQIYDLCPAVPPQVKSSFISASVLSHLSFLLDYALSFRSPAKRPHRVRAGRCETISSVFGRGVYADGTSSRSANVRVQPVRCGGPQPFQTRAQRSGSHLRACQKNLFDARKRHSLTRVPFRIINTGNGARPAKPFPSPS